MKSNHSVLFLSKKSNASWLKIVKLSAFNKRLFSCKKSNAVLFFSTLTMCFAPREIASKLKAPLPENKSKKVLPAVSNCNQLNKVSRTLLGLGRKPSASGK